MKVVVVEDSRLARAGLVRMLAGYPGIEVMGEADHPDSALPLIEATRPDVLFLDIQMAGADAFDLLARLDGLPYIEPCIVFTTAHAEYAIRSFDFDTVDYLLKPISAERLGQALRKLEARALANGASVSKAPLEASSRILIRDGERCHMVDLASIRCFESCRNQVQVYFGNQHAYIRKALNAVDERLPPGMFFRASRQHIVNLRAVAAMTESMSGGYIVTLDNGKKLEVSRRHAANLRDMLSL